MDASSSDSRNLAQWSPEYLLDQQMMNVYSGLVARWVNSQSDVGRIADLLEAIDRYKEEDRFVERHDKPAPRALKEVIARSIHPFDDQLWDLLLGDYHTAQAVLENPHLTQQDYHQLSRKLATIVLEEKAPPLPSTTASSMLQAMLDRQLPCDPDVLARFKERALEARRVDPSQFSIGRGDIDSMAFHITLHDLTLEADELEEMYERLDGPENLLMPTLIQHPGAGPSLWERVAHDWLRSSSEVGTSLKRAFLVRPESWEQTSVRQLIRETGEIEERLDLLPHTPDPERAPEIRDLFLSTARRPTYVLRRLKEREDLRQVLRPANFSTLLSQADPELRQKIIRTLPSLDSSELQPLTR